MNNPQKVYDQAMSFLNAGLSIIPVNTDGKRVKKPHFHALHGTGHSYQEEREGRLVNVPTWKEFQQTRATEEEVRAWVFKHQVTGFAVVTGEISGIVGIDFDLDGLGTLDALGWKPHVLTPSGCAHVYVKHPGFHVKTRKASGIKDESLKLPAGVDVRGDGGYIGLPPTFVKGKGQYQRTAECKFLSLDAVPEILMDGERECRFKQVLGLVREVQPKPPVRVAPVNRSEHDESPSVDPILKRAEEKAWGQGRNEAGFWFACQMRDNGYSESDTLSYYGLLVSMFPDTDSKGKRSLYHEQEFKDSVRSAYRRPARNGWIKGH